LAIVKHPVTPDGRYFVARGRLWRMASPDLDEAERADFVGRRPGGRYAAPRKRPTAMRKQPRTWPWAK
jgi:hypothetical protein